MGSVGSYASAVSLTFDLIGMSQAQDIHDPIWWKYLRRYCIHPIFWVTACIVLDCWSKKLINTSTNTNTSVTDIGWNSPHWFLRYGVHKVFRTHRLTHSLTDGQTQKQYASNTIFQWWRKHKTFPEAYCSSWIFSKRFNVVEINSRTLSAAEIISLQFQT